MKKLIVLSLCLLVSACGNVRGDSEEAGIAGQLQSNGVLNTTEQLEFMRARVAAGDEPWVSGYAQIPVYLDHQAQPFWHYIDPAVHQGPPYDVMQPNLKKDGEAAYGSALHWIITGDTAHVHKAIEMINAWAGMLQSIDPRQDGPLSASYNFPRFIYAADIIRRHYDGWAAEDQRQFESMLREIVWDGTERAINKDNKNNWRSLGINCRMAIAAYLGDRRMFDEVLGQLKDQIGAYCYPSGQSIETTRDVLHVQMGIAGIVAAAEIAWNQGVDVYSHLDNRLLTCTEWHIPHIMGLPEAEWPDAFDSPFYAPEEMLVDEPKVQMWGREISVRRGGFDAARHVGRVWHFYEKVYNHYHNRMGLDAPNTWLILTGQSPVIDASNPPARSIPVRPEAATETGGWGTLTHVRHDLIGSK